MSWVRRSALLLAAATVPAAARAQAGEPGALLDFSAGSGFLFGAPRTSIRIAGGWAMASAHSDLFEQTTQTLTLNRGDFSSATGQFDLSFALRDRTQLQFSVGVSGVNKPSEYRDYVDNADQPIEQRTTFRRIPLTVSVKQYLRQPGRAIGKLAWIPTRTAPYIGIGAGVQSYTFHQIGDFVDFQSQNLDVIHQQVTSQGRTPLVQALAGFDYSLSPRFALTTEGRYQWSTARLSEDFSGFGRLDLSGLFTTVGLTLRF